MSKRLDPYTRIMKAAAAGKGVVLSAREVYEMSFDDAIATVAENIRNDMEVQIADGTLSKTGYTKNPA
jgi:hypothetical protein